MCCCCDCNSIFGYVIAIYKIECTIIIIYRSGMNTISYFCCYVL
nr:MAG TPA: hypothetical protein [Caudoviricetes sp.]